MGEPALSAIADAYDVPIYLLHPELARRILDGENEVSMDASIPPLKGYFPLALILGGVGSLIVNPHDGLRLFDAAALIGLGAVLFWLAVSWGGVGPL
jgi:hypothetical protein